MDDTTRPPTILHDERDVCEALKIGRSTYRALIRNNELRVVRIGRSVRVSNKELARFIEERAAS